MTNIQILENFKEQDEAVDAERTSNGLMLSEADVLILMDRARKASKVKCKLC